MTQILYCIVFMILSLLVKGNAVLGSKKSVTKISKSCPTNDTMEIKGYDVKISDFVKTNGDIYNLCSSTVRLKVITVFASNKLIVDRDVDVIGSNLKLFFLAPKWVVVGTRRVAVNGAMGTHMPRAKNGTSSNTTGEDGKPGLPGGPGGNFFGVGETFINDHQLMITANGGIGGTGQYGGHGYDQTIGRYVDVRGLGGISCKLYYNICRRKDNSQLNLTDNYGKTSNFTCEVLAEKENMTRCSFKILGWEGEQGGKGGNGGMGGMGGLPGFVKLIAVNDDSHMSTYSISGNRGKDGEGGIGGRSGKNGYNFVYSNLAPHSSPKTELEEGQKTFEQLASNGSDGFNSVGYKEDPEAAEVLKPSEIENVLSEHKLWLREISGKFVNDKSITKFYRNLYDKNDLTSQFNVTYLLKEIKEIDDQFKKLRTDADFHPFYESVLRQVYGFAETFKHNKSLEQERKILSLSYSYLLGRMFTAQQCSDLFIDIRIAKFVESERNKIQEIRNMTSQNQTIIMKDTLINLYGSKENYESPITKLTIQTEWYLENKIDSLIRNSRKIVVDAMERFVKAKSTLKCSFDLEGYLTMRSYLSSITLFKDFLGIFVGFSKIVCLTVEIGSRVPDPLRVDIEKKNDTIPSGLPESMQKLNNSIFSFKYNEVTKVNELLKNILNKTKQTPKVLKGVNKKLHVVEMKLKNTSRLFAINALRSDLLKVLKIKEEELSNFTSVHKHSKKSSYVKQSHFALDYLKGIIQIGSHSRGLIDVYNEYMAYNVTYTDKIVLCCKTPKDFLHTTAILENSIYMLMYPMLQRLEDIIVETSGNYEQLAKTALDFVKQTLLYTLHRVQNNVRKLSDRLKNDFKSNQGALNQIGQGVIEILEDLGGACSALIAVFDRLQTYYQLRQLENVIADTNVAVNKGMVFSDVLLSKDFEFIKQRRGSNLVLMHYKTVVDTLKMYVFPLAQVYFKNIILPEYFNADDNVDVITDLVLTQLDNILKQVEDYKILALTGDEILSRKFFGSQSGSPSEPFFVWRNEHHKDTFLKLFSGEKVLLNADITQSLLKEGAIKLSSTDFYFKAIKEEDQKRVDKMLVDAAVMVFASHSGNSQYRYNNDIYATSSDSLELSYSYERDEFKNPIFQGSMYESVRRAEVMVSPFTLWEIQLSSVRGALGGNERAFKQLVKLKDDVDLELGGVGFFVKNQLEEFKVKKYYKPIDA